MTSTAQKPDFIQQLQTLPHLPAVAQRVLEITASPACSHEHVSRVLAGEPAIAAKILRVVNSPFYGLTGEISQISRAVTLLGLSAVRSLVLCLSVRDHAVLKSRRNADHESLAAHSIAVATACESIGRRVGVQPVEECFVAGLLHDVGQIAMLVFQPGSFERVLACQRGARGKRFLELEREAFGIDHTEAGYRILKSWGLPGSLCEVVRLHHAPTVDEAFANGRLLAVVMLADAYVQKMGVGLDLPSWPSPRASAAADLLGLTSKDEREIVRELDHRTEQALEMFALADGIAAAPEHSASGKALWLSGEDPSLTEIGAALLERCGYEVEFGSPADAIARRQDYALVVIDLPDGQTDAAMTLARELAAADRRVLILRDPSHDKPLRELTPLPNAFIIPRLFTVFDLEWSGGSAA